MECKVIFNTNIFLKIGEPNDIIDITVGSSLRTVSKTPTMAVIWWHWYVLLPVSSHITSYFGRETGYHHTVIRPIYGLSLNNNDHDWYLPR